MISQASEYRFVDFTQAEHLPTGNFDGLVMPLRTGHQGDDQDILKAEDVAFLYEGIRDKVGAMYGATVYSESASAEMYLHPGTASIPRRGRSSTPTAVPLVRQIKAKQMSDLCHYYYGAAEAGVSGVCFRQEPLAAVPKYWESETAVPATRDFPPVATGVGPLASNELDFYSGAAVTKAPVLALFEDMKLFTHPVWCVPSSLSWAVLGSGNYEVSGHGILPSPANQIMYRMDHDPMPSSVDYSYDAVNLPKAGIELISIPLDFVSPASVKVWMRFGAYNTVLRAPPGGHWEGGTAGRTGMIDITAYLVSADTGGFRKFATHPGLARQMMRYIESLYGWSEEPRAGGDYLYQELSVTYGSDFFVEFAPSGRTKWW